MPTIQQFAIMKIEMLIGSYYFCKKVPLYAIPVGMLSLWQSFTVKFGQNAVKYKDLNENFIMLKALGNRQYLVLPLAFLAKILIPAISEMFSLFIPTFCFVRRGEQRRSYIKKR